MAYTNSSLVTYTRISPNRNSPRNNTINRITIHHMAGVNSVEDFGNIVARPEREMSANYAIGNDGRIGLFCPESDRSWCSSSPLNDNQAITIEVSNSAYGDESGWPVSDAAYNSLIKLCVDICRRNGISKLEFKTDATGTLTYHYQFNNTACPGPWIKAHTADICSKVNSQLGQSGTYTGDTPTYSSFPNSAEYALTGALTNVEPDYTEIQSYMITLDRTSKNVDYDALRGIGVIGSMIEAGYLYDRSHVEVQNFRSPALESQAQAAKQADMPFALYTTVRARNVKEANLELKWFRIYIQKFTPQLGAWLRLDMTAPKAMNDMVIGRYRELLEASGLKSKIGFYVTRKELEQVSWDKWQDDFLLWLIDPVSDISEIEQLLDPTFFDL